jgi:hypothetical protein
VLGERLEPGTGAGRTGRALVAAVALCAGSLLVFIPWRAADKYYHYRNMRPDVRRLAEQHGFGNSLVIVQGKRFPDFASAAAYNPVDLKASGPIYAWDRSPEARRAVLEAYRDRTVWIIAGPTITGDGYRVEAGPVPAAELLDDLP